MKNIFLILLFSFVFSENYYKFHSEEGTIPIIIIVPHDGSIKLKSSVRDSVGGCNYEIKNDLYTYDIALGIKRRIERLVGTTPYAKVYIVHNGVHRKYVDVNRKPECAYDKDNKDAKMVYDLYHSTIKNFISDIKHNHKYGLLIDLHGQSSKSGDIFIGKSVRRFMKNGNKAESHIVSFLSGRGYNVITDEWEGGHSVSTYGLMDCQLIDCNYSKNYTINSIQLEIDKEYRFDIEKRKTLVKDLSSMIIRLINNKREYLYFK